jgi:hypothetical protein
VPRPSTLISDRGGVVARRVLRYGKAARLFCVPDACLGPKDAKPIPRLGFGLRPLNRYRARQKRASRNDDDMIRMAKTAEKPIFHIILIDRDEWAIEVEWPDDTLERVNTFRDHSAAAHWVAAQSEAWLHVLKIQKISSELRQTGRS